MATRELFAQKLINIESEQVHIITNPATPVTLNGRTQFPQVTALAGAFSQPTNTGQTLVFTQGNYYPYAVTFNPPAVSPGLALPIGDYIIDIEFTAVNASNGQMQCRILDSATGMVSLFVGTKQAPNAANGTGLDLRSYIFNASIAQPGILTFSFQASATGGGNVTSTGFTILIKQQF
jgi:hypothetical protein